MLNKKEIMRLVIQKVKYASLKVDGELISETNKGYIVFAGVCVGDTMDQVKRAAARIATMRVFRTEDGKMNKSILDIGGEVLLVSNFTLCTKEGSGARPDFSLSANKDIAKQLYLSLADELDSFGVPVKLGVFGADMQITTQLDGPTTIYKEIK